MKNTLKNKIFNETIQIKKDNILYENNLEKSRIILKDGKNNIINIYYWSIIGVNNNLVLIKRNNIIKEYSINNCPYSDLITLFIKAPTEAPKKITKKSKSKKTVDKNKKSD